jgi:hypothetical protein
MVVVLMVLLSVPCLTVDFHVTVASRAYPRK